MLLELVFHLTFSSGRLHHTIDPLHNQVTLITVVASSHAGCHSSPAVDRSPSVQRIHHGPVLRPMLWKHGGPRQRKADADTLREHGHEFCNYFKSSSYTDAARCVRNLSS